MDKVKVVWDNEKESYKIIVNDVNIFLKYGADENDNINWFNNNENTIHTQKIELKEPE